MEKRICTSCQTELTEGQFFCPTCGTKYEPPAPDPVITTNEPAAEASEPAPVIGGEAAPVYEAAPVIGGEAAPAADPAPVIGGEAAPAADPAPQVPPKHICPNCGTELAPDQKFCINCGSNVTGVQNVPPYPAQQQYIPPQQAPVKKNKKTIPIVIGAIVAFVVVAVIALALIGGGTSEKDFVGTWDAVEFYEYSTPISLSGFEVYLDLYESGSYSYCVDYEYYSGTWEYDEDMECIDCYSSSGSYQWSFYYDESTGQLEQELDEFTMVFEKE